MHQQVEPALPYYNEPLDIIIPESISIAAFEQALNHLIERREALRLRICIINGRQCSVSCRTSRSVYPSVISGTCRERVRRPRRSSRATTQAKQPFDLAHEPLIRFELVRLEESLFRLFLVGHHIALDGIAMFRVFLPELEATYRRCVAGQVPALPPLRFRYRDYVAWQRHQAETGAWESQLAFWRNHLSDVALLALPTDRPPPRGAKESFAGAREVLSLSGS